MSPTRIVSNAQLSKLILGSLKTHACVDAVDISDSCLEAKFTLKYGIMEFEEPECQAKSIIF